MRLRRHLCVVQSVWIGTGCDGIEKRGVLRYSANRLNNVLRGGNWFYAWNETLGGQPSDMTGAAYRETRVSGLTHENAATGFRLAAAITAVPEPPAFVLGMVWLTVVPIALKRRRGAGWPCTAILVACLSDQAVAGPVLARPEDQGRFQITMFASGLAYPTSMAPLDDGSLLVATNAGGPQAWINDHYLFTSPSAALVRLVDADHDGVADGPPQMLANGLPGLVSSVRRVGSLVMAVSVTSGSQAITLWRTGSSPSSPLQAAGQLSFTVPANYLHAPCALAAREAAGGGVDLYFNVGGQFNAASGTATIAVTGLAGAAFSGTASTVQLNGESIQRLVLTDTGTSIAVSPPTQIAMGLRNAAGMAFAANGDLFLQDNGIDTPGNTAVSLSADELNVIRADDLGNTVPNFGFASTYVDYATGATIGPTAGITPPVAAFLPIDGRKSEGAVELAFAPAAFPSDLKGGLFVPFSGVFNASGAANDENPLVFVDPSTGGYFHFIENRQMGHPNGLLATADALYLSDLSVWGGFGGVQGGIAADQSGAIYRITAVPEPAALCTGLIGLFVVGVNFMILRGCRW